MKSAFRLKHRGTFHFYVIISVPSIHWIWMEFAAFCNDSESTRVCRYEGSVCEVFSELNCFFLCILSSSFRSFVLRSVQIWMICDWFLELKHLSREKVNYTWNWSCFHLSAFPVNNFKNDLKFALKVRNVCISGRALIWSEQLRLWPQLPVWSVSHLRWTLSSGAERRRRSG